MSVLFRSRAWGGTEGGIIMQAIRSYSNAYSTAAAMLCAGAFVLMVVNGVRDAERGDRERFEQRENGPDRPVP